MGAKNEQKEAPGWEPKNDHKGAPGREPKMRRPLGLQMPLVYTPTHIVENKQ